MAEKDNKVRFEIVKHIGVLDRLKTGWTREVNLVSWNEGPAKIDIRAWNEDHCMMSRGLTLTEEEAKALVSMLGREFDHSLDSRISEAGLHQSDSDSLKSVEAEIEK